MEATPRQGFIERDGVRLHYREWGPGGNAAGPTLFFLHGLSSNSLFWKRVAQRLPHRRIIALDQRSHGLSDRPAGGNDPATLVADALSVIRELGAGRALIVGHSWGSTIALELAATHPDAACGILFLDGPIASMSQLMRWEDVAERMQPPFPVWPDLAAARSHHGSYVAEAWDDDLEQFVDAGLAQVDGGWTSTLTAPVRLEMLRGMFAYQPQLLWGQVDGPVWVGLALRRPGAPVGGEESRRKAVEELLAARPDARVIWYDSRHDIPLILPDQVAADIERLAVTAAWRLFAEQADKLTGDWSKAALPGPPAWSARDLLAHLASTQTALLRVAASAGAPAQGSGPPFDPDRWNRSQVERRRDQTISVLKAELAQGVESLLSLLAEANLDQTVAVGPEAGSALGAAVRVMLAHQEEHLRELNRTLFPALS